jgi:hypothetical protein
MSGTQAMPPARRRPIPGMSTAASAPSAPVPTIHTDKSASERPAEPDALDQVDAPATTAASSPSNRPPRSRPRRRGEAPVERNLADDRPELRRGRPAADYSTTRLVNFRLPVDLHERYRQLVRAAEQQYPRLRHPSLTELVIALLEEGPETAEEVAELIRRKRAAEHSDQE